MRVGPSPKRHAPLRKIIQVVRHAENHMDNQLVQLECGHTVHASSGAIYRARCVKCLKPREYVYDGDTRK